MSELVFWNPNRRYILRAASPSRPSNECTSTVWAPRFRAMSSAVLTRASATSFPRVESSTRTSSMQGRPSAHSDSILVDQAIDFALPDQEGKPWRLDDHIARCPVLLVFYRGDW